MAVDTRVYRYTFVLSFIVFSNHLLRSFLISSAEGLDRLCNENYITLF